MKKCPHDELEKSFHFKAYESIHTEFSNKYLLSDVERWAHETGFEIARNFLDQQNYFVDSLWRARKEVDPSQT